MIDAPKMTTILWIEGNKNATPSFVPGLRKKGYLVTSVPTGKEALSFVSTLVPNLVVVNAASLRSNGERICGALRSQMKISKVETWGRRQLTPRQADRATHGGYAGRKATIGSDKSSAWGKNTKLVIISLGSAAIHPWNQVVKK